jgi:hypothetical protein
VRVRLNVMWDPPAFENFGQLLLNLGGEILVGMLEKGGEGNGSNAASLPPDALQTCPRPLPLNHVVYIVVDSGCGGVDQ